MNVTLNNDQSDALRPSIVAKVAADKTLDRDMTMLLAGMAIPRNLWTGDIREEGDVFVITIKDDDGTA